MSELSLPEPDRETIKALQSGSHSAFRQIYELYKDRIYNLGLHMLGDSDQAAEAAQKSFVKLFGVAHSFRGESQFGTWFYRLSINVCHDLIRQRRQTAPLETVDDHLNPRPSVPGIEFDVTEIIQKAVHNLPETYRTVIVLRYVEDLSYTEIADVLECSIGTVGSRMNRAHKLLETRLAHLRGEG